MRQAARSRQIGNIREGKLFTIDYQNQFSSKGGPVDFIVACFTDLKVSVRVQLCTAMNAEVSVGPKVTALGNLCPWTPHTLQNQVGLEIDPVDED